MFLRKDWIPLSVCLVAVVSVGLYLQATQPPPEPIKIYKPVEPLATPTQAPTTQTPVGEKTEQGGHWHADGTWHGTPHVPGTHPATPSRQTIRAQTVSPKSGARPSSKDTGEWKVLWPPPIPGFGQHPPRNIPDLPEAFILAYADRHFDLEVALERGDISAAEKDRKLVEYLADAWGVDPDDGEGLVAAMRDFGKAFPEVLNTLPPERAFEVAREFEISRDLSENAISVKTYAEAALAVNPNNIEARHTLAKTISDYEAILEIDPNNYRAMRRIGDEWDYDRPEEAIEILKKAKDLGSTAADAALGQAYERLGDYKTAWMHYYQYKTAHPHGHGLVVQHMAAIVSGEPRWPPIRRAAPVNAPEPGAYGNPPSGSFETVSDTAGSFDTSPDPFEPAAAREGAAQADAAAQAATDARAQQQQIQREIEDFIHWLEQAENETPDAEDFLSQQMQKHLRGSDTPEFAPERLIRAQETLDRYGPEEGMRRLESTDPKVAERVRRNPPRPRQGASPPRPRK